MLEEAVELSASRLLAHEQAAATASLAHEQAAATAGNLPGNLASGLGGTNSHKLADSLALGGIVAGLQAQAEAVTAAVLLPALRAGAVDVSELRLKFGPVVASIVEDSLWLSTLPERLGLQDDDGRRLALPTYSPALPCPAEKAP